jgi:hypothetical protein
LTEKITSQLSGRRVPIAILIGLTLLSGVVHGVLDGRWSQPENLMEQGSRLEQLPDAFGDWELVESKGLAKGASEILRCFGSTNRIYRHRDNHNLTVNVAIMFGPRGPIAVHTPEVCYDSVGTEQLADRQVETVSTVQNRHELWSVPFSRRNATNDFEVWYAWSDGGNWQAVKQPRFWMTETLYKIQLAGPVGDDDNQPCREFLEAFLPEVEKVLQ